ncbi:MAG TPA: NnrU family protein [Rhizomicrobium sp.]|jgi:uncharacterized membrane protein|nr:NnrU family protein [Rhizomicrobium sp.]
MNMLIAAAAVFLGIHLLIAGTKIRDAITGAIGENAYLGLFSLASIVVISWLVIAYNAAQASGADPILYSLGEGIRHLGIPVVLLAFLLAVPGLIVPNPTSLKQEGAAAKPIKSVLAITRHPFLWGVAIWAAFHTAANGDEASVIFFGTFLVLALAGTVSIDAKRKRKMGAAWDAFAARTSNIPFGAVASGRASLVTALDWRMALALVVFVAVLFSHAHVIGVSPFPGGWRPF